MKLVCSKCEIKFTIFDQLHVSATDKKILCADCKGIIRKKRQVKKK